MRYTEYHAGKAVIKDKDLLAEAMEKLARMEDAEEKDRLGQWIPCSERMPKERDSMFARWKGTDKWEKAMFEKRSDTVIATIEYSNGERTVAPAHTTDGKWRCDCIIGDDGEVIAWMPFPEPYRQNNEGDDGNE